ncbi:extracellular solute-binding protein [Glutamicibacter sp.]|uniref:extracellular solute-binding protein n=1 Tax=Glutamicibacter sp. TaxID=1931995 RepID=UPI003D6A08A8
MKKTMLSLAAALAAVMGLTACGGTGGDTAAPAIQMDKEANADKSITLWLAGADTPDDLRAYLKDTFKERTGASLKIEEQGWGDLVTKMTTALPDANNTPDVVEMGNTQSPTFTSIGAFLDLSEMYEDLGGSNLIPSFVEAGSVDGTKYTLPYYAGSRFMFYRKDLWEEAGVKAPTTLDEFNAAAKSIASQNPRGIKNFSGFFLGGQDWRNAVSWIFANGGDLARKDGDKWVSTLADANTLKGLEQLQAIYQDASHAPADAKDVSPWLYINDADQILDEAGKPTGKTELNAATIMAPNWARWSIGDLAKADGKEARKWNEDKFGIFALPGNDGNPAPVLAGGSNIGISAKSQNPELSKELLRIIFSEDYQTMLGENGLGPGNLEYSASLGDDAFATTAVEAMKNSKLTPAAPGWAAVETNQVLEEFFGKIATATDLKSLAEEYDAKITPMLNLE